MLLDDGYLVFSAVPTGVFVDTAMSLVTRFVPEPSLEERRAALIAASKLARGVTSVVDFGRFRPGETTQQAWDNFNGIKCPTFFVMLSCPCMSSKVHVEEHGVK